MKLVTTLTKDNQKDYFILPSFVYDEDIEKYLKALRNQTWGSWKRIHRDIISIETFVPESFPKNTMKYICTSCSDTEQEYMVIFSKSVNHDCMEEWINALFEYCDTQGFHISISAGFTDLSSFYGLSETLNLSSRDEDLKVYKKSLKVC